MPPKFGLALALEVPPDHGSPQDGSQTQQPGNSLRDSWKVNENGSVTMLTKSITPYEFSSEGLIKSAGAAQHHYRVSEQDLFLIKQLGHGACGIVHKAYLHNEDKFVAVKRINIIHKETRQQMLADVKALCDSPNLPGLIQFHGAFHVPDSGQISLVLEYMDGGTLADVLKQVGRIPEQVLAAITADVLQGLAALHKKHMVHRDIKPANILMNMAGKAKISDFGISTMVDNTLAACKTYTGTVTYMSPERIENKPYNSAADIWSLGLVLLECVLGRYPYDTSGGPMDLMLHIMQDPPALPGPQEASPQLRDLLAACLAMDPRQRPRAEQLLGHAFLAEVQQGGNSSSSSRGSGAPGGEVKVFMRCMFDPVEKLDEIGFKFSWNYYQRMSMGPEGVEQLCNLYLANSVMSHGGQVCIGREAISLQLQASRCLVGVGGSGVKWGISSCDSQPLGLDGTILTHVVGSISYAHAGAVCCATFTEAFILSQASPGQYYVANQVFRLLKG